ncbi:MAG: DUF374 domain-containing protein [Pseudomonadota bacterium]
MAKTRLQYLKRRTEMYFQRAKWAQRLVRGGLTRYLRWVHRTTRWTYLDMDRYGVGGDQSPALLCVWHETLPGTVHALKVLDRPTKALASDHADGLIVVHVIEDLGFQSILLSTSRDKTGSLKETVKWLRGGGSVSVTPDGPMGPAREAKAGAITMASLSGAPLIPFGYATKPALRLPTWDRMVLPLPYGRGVLSAGTPKTVARRLNETDVAALCKDLGEALDAEQTRCKQALRR